MRFLGYTYMLKPTREQIAIFSQFAGVCRLVWNLALEQRREHWRRFQNRTGNNLNYVSQCRELTAIRAEFDFIRSVPCTSQQRVLKSLEDAFQSAWKGNSGFPQPKKKGKDESFSFSGREITVERFNRKWGRVRLPKIGWVKLRLTRDMIGSIREATVSLTPIGWQISIGCKQETSLEDNGLTVGIDRGVSIPVMLSDGTAYRLPAHLNAVEHKTKKAHRIASRRKRGSARWHKAVLRVARLSAKMARIRKHWAHETTTEICRNYGGVVLERLRTKNMTRSAKGTIDAPGNHVSQKRALNRVILNTGWHQIETMLFYKAARFTKVDPTYSSQTCASCGAVDRQSRKSQANFSCTTCGHTDNADRNAAIIILNRGNTSGVEVTGCRTAEARSIRAIR